MTLLSQIQTIRAFNRTVTERIGVLEEHYLARRRSLGLDRVLWEIGDDGLDVRELRMRLGLDSGYLSRQLRALEDEGLVTLSLSEDDRRVRQARLTSRGVDELAVLDQLSDELVESILAPLTARQREQLAEATATVERLFSASAVSIGPSDPASPQARQSLAAYYSVLDERFEEGFEPEQSSPATEESLRAPRGQFLIATAKDTPVGCVGITAQPDGSAEIRRLWVCPQMRGVGLGRRLVQAAEQAAAALGARIVRLETNHALTEAIGLYWAMGYREVAPFNDEPYAHHWFEKPLHTGPIPAGRTGFLGLGIMGLPMARRLAGSGVALTVWNRTPTHDPHLHACDIRSARHAADVFAECETVLMMLRDEAAVDEVLRRAPGGLSALVAGHTIVNMATLSPQYAQTLAREIEAAGGRYVEAPVSGSQRPAEDGTLIAMVAGSPDVVAQIRPLLAPMCARTVVCGPVPSGTNTKLAANIFLLAQVTGLAEAFHMAQRSGVDEQTLRSVLDTGQMASPISRLKTAKITAADFTAQAAITDAHRNARLIVDAAAASGTATPLSEVCETLYAEAARRGHGALDMVTVIRAFDTSQQR